MTTADEGSLPEQRARNLIDEWGDSAEIVEDLEAALAEFAAFAEALGDVDVVEEA